MAQSNTPAEQLKFELEYNILNRELEIEILTKRITPLKTQLFTEDNKKIIQELNETVMVLEVDKKKYEAEIKYYQEKLKLLANKK